MAPTKKTSPKKTTRKTAPRAPKAGCPARGFLSGAMRGIGLTLRFLVQLVLIFFKILWRLAVVAVFTLWQAVLKIFQILGASAKMILATILTIAISIFLLSLSVKFLIDATNLNESKKWAQTREKFVQMMTTRWDFEIGQLQRRADREVYEARRQQK